MKIDLRAAWGRIRSFFVVSDPALNDRLEEVKKASDRLRESADTFNSEVTKIRCTRDPLATLVHNMRSSQMRDVAKRRE